MEICTDFFVNMIMMVMMVMSMNMVEDIKGSGVSVEKPEGTGAGWVEMARPSSPTHSSLLSGHTGGHHGGGGGDGEPCPKNLFLSLYQLTQKREKMKRRKKNLL